jgi:hypothetical protein
LQKKKNAPLTSPEPPAEVGVEIFAKNLADFFCRPSLAKRILGLLGHQAYQLLEVLFGELLKTSFQIIKAFHSLLLLLPFSKK